MTTQLKLGEMDGAPQVKPGDPLFTMREPPGRLGVIVRRLKRMTPAPPPFPAPAFSEPAPEEAD